jgi:hypothetical protein
VTHAHFADYLSISGRHSEAIAAYSRVLALDPMRRRWTAAVSPGADDRGALDEPGHARIKGVR